VEYKDILVEKDGHIATITLNQPEKMNAISRNMGDSLILARDEVVKDDDIRVVIVTGAGRGSSLGNPGRWHSGAPAPSQGISGRSLV
jgi:enoyl-CoA hydratase/carnithine racemase